MGLNGFIRGETWDYERITYDYRIGSPEKGVNYYIRIQGYATEGDIDRGNAVVQLMTPIIGKHYYPHGIEYDEENFSKSLIERATGLVIKARDRKSTRLNSSNVAISYDVICFKNKNIVLYHYTTHIDLYI